MFKKTTRYFAFVLALAILCSAFAGCNGSEGSHQIADDSVKIWYAYNTENLMQDLEYPELMAERDATLRMHGIRNEVESIQLMITPSVNVNSFDFTMYDLKNTAGDVLAADTFEIFAQWYTEVTESYNTDSYYGFCKD